MNEIIVDQDARQFRLNANKLRKVDGTRYATRASIAKVLRGEQKFVVAGSAHPNAKKRWAAVANKFQLRIGCRKFTGNSLAAIREWAR